MTGPMRVADRSALPLGHRAGEAGRALIEASAGTGKTWTIAVLYLRLLLEQPLTPRHIVVTTFTDAAAQELRERLRAKLQWAQRLARDGIPPDDAAPDATWLSTRWGDEPARAAADGIRLRLALVELDRAPIGTLHGLCRRILADFPFECGSAFQLGELVPGDALDRELTEDLWRELGQREAPLAEGDVAWFAAGFDKLAAALRVALRPGVRVQVPDAGAVTRAMQPANAQAIRAWIGDGTMFKRSNSALLTALRALADYIEAGDLGAELADLDAAFARPLDSQLKADFADPDREEQVAVFAGWAQVLRDRAVPARAAALAGYRDWILGRRETLLRARNQLSYDALIGRVHGALARRGGVLADRLFAEWPVALVDEFQDTDQQQYGILDRIYRAADGEARGRLVMIGDPKQAIYRFRGGDIHAYLAAAHSAGAVLRLDRNFRSSAALVDGFNALYAQAGPDLSQRGGGIRYEPVAAGRPQPVLHRDGEPVARPLVLHLWRDPPDGKGERERRALEACAAHVATLLEEGLRIGERPLEPGDIAVLVPTNAQVETLRERLLALGVPCVGAGRGNVFDTDEARELQIVLHAIEHAGDEAALRAALLTRLIGVKLAALVRLREDAVGWNAHAGRFVAWHRQWRQEGVLAVVQAVLAHAAPAILAGADGERRLTDLRHLGELLQQAEDELHGAEQVLAWLARQRDGEGGGSDAASEEQQLRIESDARRVRLMTLHASKGLEFPVVLLPLMWAQEGREERQPLHYDPASGERELVLGGPGHAAACEEVAWEDQDERFRMLYVALTRAALACHVYVLPPDRRRDGRIKAPPQDPQRSALDATIERLRAAGTTQPAFEWIEDGWPWVARPKPAPAIAPGQPRAVPELPATRPVRQIYSFSMLTREVAGAWEDAPASDESVAVAPADARDAEPIQPALPDPALQALAAWRGADFGNAVHAVFEHRELGVPLARQLPLVVRSLQEAGVRRGDEAVELLARRLLPRLQATLDAELAPGLSLGALSGADLRAEMAFHFALDEVALAALRDACAAHGEPALVPRTPLPVLRGLMTGKIDLVLQHAGRFHVLDYKTNWLGETLEAYLPQRLDAAMDGHHYRFQALLYTLAVHRLLRQRLGDYDPHRHLGEALYLFVRAVGIAPGAGVWRHRFEPALLEAVDRAFGARMEVA